MSDATHNLPVLSPKRLARVAAAIFLIHLFVAFVFSEKVSTIKSNYQPQFLSKMTFEPIRSDSETYQLFSPALFAFATPNSFSGKVWLKEKFAPQQYYEWSDAAFWLRLIPDYLGNDFKNLLASIKSDSRAELRETPPSVTVVENASPPIAQSASRIRVEGELSKRPLLRAPELPIFYSNDIYPPSIVYAVVNEDGFVISSALINESGYPAADTAAIELTKKLIFTPLKSQQNYQRYKKTMFGKIIFDWYFSKTNNQAKPHN
ncbi:MAG: energy transducer TonB [Verrucomicrobiia bacterium]